MLLIMLQVLTARSNSENRRVRKPSKIRKSAAEFRIGEATAHTVPIQNNPHF